eukprot:CAMPEP_0201567722 /NCGR_PEP_ID=MMETSP0190_2-20130828/8349_1 /ASSEMBLY_ACC=CAM_ASM_000263 /TAXON_ID=37353 /ORGANISM="Rosalina sp." /LENGTH=283 /DNA_ID=CAMNT_0047988045 /DNA_START=37 /DNA_END=888 /DNA_ORIENTATION=+
MAFLRLSLAIPLAAALSGPIFELDLFINDPSSGYQPTGWPQYLQTNATKYMNVAGISFIQPSDLMNPSYDLPTEVATAVKSLRAQGVTVQLLVGGEISSGWPQLESNPTTAANTAIALMKKYDCGIEIDNESGGDTSAFIKAVAAGKPSGTYISMDVNGTPTGFQVSTYKGAADDIDWVNLMVSNPAYDQENSMTFANNDGIPYSKQTVAYYAGTWVNNCNTVGSASDYGDTANGVALVKKHSARGLSVWAVGGASYGGCSTTDAPGFSQAMKDLGASNSNKL